MPELTEIQKKRLMETLGTSAVNPWSDGANVNSNVPALDPSFYDDAVRNLKDGTQLGARTTGLPVTVRRMADGTNYPEPAAGDYWPTRSSWKKTVIPASIDVILRRDAGGADLNGTLQHENVHAALDRQSKAGLPQPSYIPPPTGVMDLMKMLLGNRPTFPGNMADPSDGNPGRVWETSGRAGRGADEIPSYMLAYKEGQLKDVTPEHAAAYRDRYLASASPELRALLQHILGIK